MRIPCPECEASLNLGDPKPGNYRPKCSKCGQRFRLKVGDGDPPKVTVARDDKAEASNQKKPSSKPPTASATRSTRQIEETLDNTSAKTVGNVDETMGETIASVSPVSSKPVSEKAVSKPIVSVGSSSSSESEITPAPIPERVGGYRVLRLLGRGAMGAVYEAKQISLDRLVALKTIRDRLVSNPASLARFTREAYSAAQLTHHNVVQIYDFGEDDGRYFFSMERVQGGALDELIREKGALDPKLAAGYALQAARGLRFAHQHGMVHRDIKPANLLLSDEGIVKVADLGLVKIPDQHPESEENSDPHSVVSGMESGTQVTMQGTAVGTPAYMAPEQGIDAAAVDHRADLYSLGCTLYYMLAGRPPFEGTVVSEVLDQHARADAPNLSQLNPRVPEQLSSIVRRAMAKRPSDRYSSAAEMIRDLESFLGVAGETGFTPSTDQADQWEAIAQRFASAAPALRLARYAMPIAVLISVLLLVTTLWIAPSLWLLAPSWLIASTITALLMDRREEGHPVAVAGRRWLASMSWTDWAVGALTSVVLVLVSFAASWWIGLIVGLIIGGICGAAYQLVLVYPSLRQQQPPLDDAERFIRDLRISGADEEGIRTMVARYSGKSWQWLFEALFGYPSLVQMRMQLRRDPSFSGSTSSTSLRDKVCANLNARADANQARRDQKRLAKIEQQGLQSQGVSANEAREQAWQIAAGVIEEAKSSKLRESEAEAAVQAKRDRMKAMLADARSGKHRKPRDPMAPLKFALGGQTRLLIGLLLTTIFALWGNQQGVFDSLKQLDTLNELSSGRVDLDEVSSALRNTAAAAEQQESPATVLGTSPWSVGAAGILMMMSAFVSGWRMTPFALLATIVILYGPAFGIPSVGPLKSWMIAALAGMVVYLPGVIWGETKE